MREMVGSETPRIFARTAFLIFSRSAARSVALVRRPDSSGGASRPGFALGFDCIYRLGALLIFRMNIIYFFLWKGTMVATDRILTVYLCGYERAGPDKTSEFQYLLGK